MEGILSGGGFVTNVMFQNIELKETVVCSSSETSLYRTLQRTILYGIFLYSFKSLKLPLRFF